MMPKVLVAALLILIGDFLSVPAPASQAVQKVRIGYPSAAVSTLPFDIAKEKGFYAKVGLDVEYIQMRTAIAPQRYSTAISTSSPRRSPAYRRLLRGCL